jgi:hypothetical protein
MTDVPRDDQQPSVEPSTAADGTSRSRERQAEQPDPNDEVPVPIAMSPAEVDERAQVVEALREEEGEAPSPEQTDQRG